MQYVLVFLEGIITFVSPCLLPMLPIYVGYFMGAGEGESSHRTVLLRAFGFVLGFTILFVVMGAFAGTIGSFFVKYATAVNLVGGAVITVLGLIYLGILNIPIFNGAKSGWHGGGFFTSLLMGVVFSVGWTPCVGAFLGSALVLASQSGSVLRGAAMLLLYSLGLGIPFLLGAVLMERLKNVFNWLKKHSGTVSHISGGLLVALGILMMTGLLGRLLGLVS
ncbi:cytochrome c biogenesis protein CcdA [Oscillibacter sp.]|uniref:cytochrome c biogenesis CcdA family protein n=1 Tax=Oscillibacter sp. TaxID=1945593 RepID=UPI00339B1664